MAATQVQDKITGTDDDLLARAEAFYEEHKAELESLYFGKYILINTETLDYVTGPTVTGTHMKFMETFGENAPGWMTRVGVSIFVTI